MIFSAWKGSQKISEQTVTDKNETVLAINDPQLWSPTNPFLYDLKVTVMRKGKIADEIKSYFANKSLSN